jgi:hypothetical protein
MSTKRHTMLDDGESVFFSRELQFVKSKTYDVKYANLKARQLFPVSNEAGPGAETIAYESYDHVGIAKVIASYADDIPRADIKGKLHVNLVKGLASAYGYNIQEIRAAKMKGLPLTQRKANAAKRAILSKENQIAFLGDSDSGLVGFINNANISSTTIPGDGSGSATTFASKTVDKILRDMNTLANYPVTNTLEVEVPDTMIMPLSQFNLIRSTPWSTTGDGKSILELFLKNQSYIKEIIAVDQLKGAGSGATDRMMVYRKDPEAISLEIPQDFEQFEEQPRNMEYVVPCHSRIGGVIIYYPLSVAYVDGI